MVATYEELRKQAKVMRDEMVAASTSHADQWFAKTLQMLRALPIASLTQIREDDVEQSGEDGQSDHTDMSLREQVETVIDDMPKHRFTTVHVRNAIETTFGYEMSATQRANLANMLRRLAGREKIELLSKGSGSKPSTYRKKKEAQKDQETSTPSE